MWDLWPAGYRSDSSSSDSDEEILLPPIPDPIGDFSHAGSPTLMPFNLKGSVDSNALKKTSFKVTPKGKGGKGKLERLHQLPKSWWKLVEKD